MLKRESKMIKELINHKTKISVIGLGYVGLPLAYSFALKGLDVIGFDTNSEKIELYKKGIDVTKEIGDENIKNSSIVFSTNEEDLKLAKFHIVAIPTPIKQNNIPDLSLIISASKILGRNLNKGSIVVYESTVYPGCTEEICLPILEEYSGLKCGKDFKLGYSPERINPGDKTHKLENIVKIVSGMDLITTKDIQDVYEYIITKTHPVSNIKTAEAIKVVENTQRSLNIAFMNEMSQIFDKMDIDSSEVVKGMNTKWNALGFRPGLVGGHCIGVDPYYLIYQAERIGYHSKLLCDSCLINEEMGQYIALVTINKMLKANINLEEAKVYVLGFTFKENCSDIRNSKVNNIILTLKEHQIKPMITDPWANSNEVKKEYGYDLVNLSDIKDADCLIIAVAHDEYKKLKLSDLEKMYNHSNDKSFVLIDVKGMFDLKELQESKFEWWRL